MNSLKNKILFSIVLGGIIFLAFSIYADFDKVLIAFSDFNLLLLPILLFLSLLNYLTRFLKWDYYLNKINIKLKKVDSLSIFMSGLIMSVTPGKIGELLKSYLVKQVNGEPISKTAPVVMVERISDFISLTIITLIGAYTFNYGKIISITVAIILVVIIILFTNKKISFYIFNYLRKIKPLSKHINKIYQAYESSYKLLMLKPLILMVLLSIISWLFECLGYYIILINFGMNISFFWSSFSYSFSIIAGAISMLPGGLGVTEGSLTFLLAKKNFSLNEVIASTFLIRVVTLWFAVLVGIFSISFYKKKFGIIENN